MFIEPVPWGTEAKCLNADPDAFFPEKGGSTREAKRICAECTVRAECLEYAVENRERFGVWGGLSERERRKLARLLEDRDLEVNDLEPDELDELATAALMPDDADDDETVDPLPGSHHPRQPSLWPPEAKTA